MAGSGVSANLRHARRAVTLAFLVHGMASGGWVPRIPQIKEQLGLTEGALGIALLGGPVGVVFAVRFAGAIIVRWGSRATTRVSGVLTCACLVLPGLAGNLGGLIVALTVFGAAIGVFDVAMNTHGVAVERWYGRPLMSGLHGAWSVGALTSALIGSAAAHAEVMVRWHLAALAMVLAAVLLPGTRRLLGGFERGGFEGGGFEGGGGDLPDGPASGAAGTLPRSGLWAVTLLGLIGLCSFLGEGAVADWSAVHLKETLGTGAGTAGLGYAGCAVAMAAGRLGGDTLVARFGPVRVLRTGSAVAAIGLAIGLLVAHPVVLIIGFTLFGLGIAPVAPITFGAAGNLPGVPPAMAISRVTSIGYLGFLGGPPMIGFVAEVVGLTWALAIPAGLAGLIALLAGAAAAAKT